uniref:ATP-binding subunit of clp protease n=1 Tax=Climaconeis sp. TaxID=2846830 RepID=A0A8F8SQU3_9STRA|nr:ATP-binding subunit of clp protease [Climaconeis sp.]QYB18955.1 ATP-binding subunit of clp protease [Climaconeis sp.]
MFEKFTEGAIKVIMIAQEESRRMGHNFVGTEQLLLGVIGQKHGIGARSLRRVQVTTRKIRREIELYVGLGTGFVGLEIPFTPRAKRVLEMAVQEAKDINQNFVGTEHILLALVNEPDGVARRTLENIGVDIRRLRRLIIQYIEETQERLGIPISQSEKFLRDREKYGSFTPTLDEYSENITQEAIDGNLDPILGREKEINDVVAVLARRTKNNPVLIGEPGVGKTAVAEGLAQLILTEQGPEFLDGHIVIALDLGSTLAGTKYRGEFEDRLKRIVQEVQYTPTIILVIDEIHTLVGAGAAEGAVDAANILKPALARGKLRCLGATTSAEYKKYIERDPALERRFQPVFVAEPDIETTIQILRGLRGKFEQHHVIFYSDEAIEQAAILSKKYIADRFLPDKAIDVLDEAGARVRLQNKRLPKAVRTLLTELQLTLKEKDEAMRDHDFEAARQLVDHEMEVRAHIRIIKTSIEKKREAERKKQEEERKKLYSSLVSVMPSVALPKPVTELEVRSPQEIDTVTGNDIAKVISNWTGIPITKLTGSESERLLKMESTLHERLIGQDHAVTAVSKAIRRARAGLRNPNRPISSFIFAGPTGVGKTELTKALAEYMFANDDSLIRLDMSEYMEKHTVAKLIGSPPGYVGYQEGGFLTEEVRAKPYSVVLFDEVEKAHPDVFNLLLQILDDGRLSDSQGRVIDFTNTLIILTTNLGAKIIEVEGNIESKTNKNLIKTYPDMVNGWAPAPEPEKDQETIDRIEKLVNEELKNFFRPEFLNRVDDIIVFNHLTRKDIWDISGLMIKEVQERMKSREINLVVRDSVRALLADKGYNPIYGARPLRRAIIRFLEDDLADVCLGQTFYPYARIIVDRKMDSVSATYTEETEILIDFFDVDLDILRDLRDRGEKIPGFDDQYKPEFRRNIGEDDYYKRPTRYNYIPNSTNEEDGNPPKPDNSTGGIN